MANKLTSYTNTLPLITTQLASTRVQLCTPLNQGEHFSTIPITIDWFLYANAAKTAAPAMPILINLQTGVANPISGIRSIKIDNIGVPSPCTVFFPDTGDEIICSPDSTVMANVLTGQLTAIVAMPIGTGNLGTSTRLFFNNFQLDPAQIANQTATFNYEYGTGTPFSIGFTRARAIGDEWQNASINLSILNSVSLFNGPPNGYNSIVVSECRVSVYGSYTDAASPQNMSCSIVDETAAVYKTFNWFVPNDLSIYPYKRVYDMTEAQQNFGGSIGGGINHKYFFQNNAVGNGVAVIELVYTLVSVVNLP